MGGVGDPDDLEVLLALARRGPLATGVILALIRRILEVQDTAGDEELLALVAQVEALLQERPAED